MITKLNSVTNSKTTKVFDWLLGIIVTLYGMYEILIDVSLYSISVCCFGVVCLFFAYRNPINLLGSIIKKNKVSK